METHIQDRQLWLIPKSNQVSQKLGLGEHSEFQWYHVSICTKREKCRENKISVVILAKWLIFSSLINFTLLPLYTDLNLRCKDDDAIIQEPFYLWLLSIILLKTQEWTKCHCFDYVELYVYFLSYGTNQNSLNIFVTVCVLWQERVLGAICKDFVLIPKIFSSYQYFLYYKFLEGERNFWAITNLMVCSSWILIKLSRNFTDEKQCGLRQKHCVCAQGGGVCSLLQQW